MLGVDETDILGFLESCYVIARNQESSGVVLEELWDTLKDYPEVNLDSLMLAELETAKHFTASNPNLPIRVMREISQQDEYVSTVGLTDNPNLDIVVLENIRNSNHLHIRRLALMHEKVTLSMLKLFPGDDEAIGVVLARNPLTPIKVLEELANANNSWAWRSLVSNPSVPVGIAASWLKRLMLTETWGWDSDIVIPSPVLVEVLKGTYPDVHVGMPREWLLNLIGDDEK